MVLKEWFYFNKKKIVIFSGILVVGLSLFIYYLYDTKDDSSLKEDKVEEDFLVKKEEEVIEDNVYCYFDIKGEVKSPGVYLIDCDSRVNDAINLSGGLTSNSDTSVLNLSKKIHDGMVIIVYSKKEVSSYLETLKKEESKKEMCNSSNITNDACIDSSVSNSSNNSLVNINTASLEELMTLSGIGEAKAKNIISYRSNTSFEKVEDLLNVEGIGESLYASIKENITV